jgi:type I restriction enzyme, S subunit
MTNTSEWHSVPLKSLFRRRNSVGQPDLPLLSVYRDFGVVPRAGREDNFNKASDDLSSYRVVHPGDLVLNKMKTWQGSLGISDYHGIVSPAYFVCEQIGSGDTRFLHHLLRSGPLIAEYGARSKGIRPSQWDLPWHEFRDIRVNLPPAGVQRVIADFLDAEMARIDALIEKKRRLIELLNERRENFIAEAVTVGLDATTPLRATGNPLAPEIPVGWDLVRLKRVVHQIVDTEHATAPTYDEGHYLVVRTTNVKQGQLVLDDASYTDEVTWRRWTRRAMPQPGDVLLTREAPAGESCVVPVEPALCIGQRMVLLVPDRTKVVGEWLVHSLYSGPAQTFVSLLSRSTTVAHINMADIPNVPVVVPPLEVQRELLAGIHTEADRLTTASVRTAKQIELLVEHRQALITAVVTGELDIGNAA